MQKAKDIMSSPPINIREDQTLQDAIKLLAEHRFSGVPVVNSAGKIMGIISDTDIIRYSEKVKVVPNTNLSGWISPYADVSTLATMRKGMDTLHQTRVSDVMTKKVYVVNEEAEASDIARLMNRRNINRIPVVNSDNELVGIVTRADMVQCMAQM